MFIGILDYHILQIVALQIGELHSTQVCCINWKPRNIFNWKAEMISFSSLCNNLSILVIVIFATVIFYLKINLCSSISEILVDNFISKSLRGQSAICEIVRLSSVVSHFVPVEIV